MKLILLILLLLNALFADTKRVCFYTSDNNVNNFKALKVSFDTYLNTFGEYEFQAFSDRKNFEKCVSAENTIVILSSWHYTQVSKQYRIQAKLIAQKSNKTTDTKVLIGKSGVKLHGIVTSAYKKSHTQELLKSLVKEKSFSIIQVPKELDALMAVGFGMSQFALVSKDSFLLLQDTHGFLAKDLTIYRESQPSCRMLVASKSETISKHFDIFTKMNQDKNGQQILYFLGVDEFVILNNNDLKNIGDIK